MSGGQGGFSLLELLIASAVSALLAAAIAATVPSLQAFFEQTPAAIDMQQRGRTALDAIAQAVRGADRVVLLDEQPGTQFRQLTTITPRADAGRGVVERDQIGAGGELVLSPAGCPAAPEMCGFIRGATTLIDGGARFEVFIVGALTPPARLAPRRPLAEAYAAGAVVVEVDAFTFRLAPQPDGSSSLVRETGAGALQPIADRVSGLRFEPAFGGKGIEVAVTLQWPGRPGQDSTRRMAIVARNVR